VSRFSIVTAGMIMLSLLARPAVAAGPPAVGAPAPDFRLTTLDGDAVTLTGLKAEGPVVLVVLRGYPGYQCPVCNVQVGELIGNAGAFESAGARVVLVYPGRPENLGKFAGEFVKGKSLPERFVFLTDPGYTLTEAYGLRWDAPGETAYPSAFVIDPTGKVTYAKVSRSHGGRAKAAELLSALKR